MKIEITRDAKKNTIVVEFTDNDRQFNIQIPAFEYKEWLRYNEQPATTQTLACFVDEYFAGVISSDDTGQILISKILDKWQSPMLRIDDSVYIITNTRFGLNMHLMVDAEKKIRLNHEQLVEVYTASVLSYGYRTNLN